MYQRLRQKHKNDVTTRILLDFFPDQKDANARFYTRVGTSKYLVTKPIEGQVNIVTMLVTRIKAWKSRNQWKGIVLACIASVCARARRESWDESNKKEERLLRRLVLFLCLVLYRSDLRLVCWLLKLCSLLKIHYVKIDRNTSYGTDSFL